MSESSITMDGRRLKLLFFVGSFFLTLGLNFETLTEPPVWDAATGLFPAAIELARSGFDFGSLLEQPGWTGGGPNTYAAAPLTWVTALFFLVFSDPAHALFGVHLMHFLLSAWLLTTLFFYSRPVVGDGLALLTTLAVAVFPIYIVQTGYMYLEIPLALATILALDALAEEKVGTALIWGIVAASMKALGLTTIALILLAVVLRHDPIRDKLRKLALALFALGLMVVRWMFETGGSGVSPGAGESLRPPGLNMDFLTRHVIGRLDVVPEISWMIALVSGTGLLFGFFHFKAFRSGPAGTRFSPGEFRLALANTYVLSFIGFFLLLSVTGLPFWMLPRYTVAILPFLVLCSVWLARMVVGRVVSRARWADRTTLAVGLVLCGALLMNYTGRYYKPFKKLVFSFVERDMAYKDFLFVQKALSEKAVEFPDDVPKFYPRAMSYFLTYPEMGYVPRAVKNGHFVYQSKPYVRGRIGDYPDHFVLIHSNASHGAEILRHVLKQARSSSRYTVQTVRVHQNGFTGSYSEIRRKSGRK